MPTNLNTLAVTAGKLSVSVLPNGSPALHIVPALVKFDAIVIQDAPPLLEYSTVPMVVNGRFAL